MKYDVCTANIIVLKSTIYLNFEFTSMYVCTFRRHNNETILFFFKRFSSDVRT